MLRDARRSVGVASFGMTLLWSAGTGAWAQQSPTIEPTLRPPLDVASSHNRTSSRTQYVLPGTRAQSATGSQHTTTSMTPRPQTSNSTPRPLLAPPPRSTSLPALQHESVTRAPAMERQTSSPLPSPRRLSEPATRQLPEAVASGTAPANAANHRVGTPATLRYATTPQRHHAPYYPTPSRTQPPVVNEPNPLPSIPQQPTPQTTISVSPVVPYYGDAPHTADSTVHAHSQTHAHNNAHTPNAHSHGQVPATQPLSAPVSTPVSEALPSSRSQPLPQDEIRIVQQHEEAIPLLTPLAEAPAPFGHEPMVPQETSVLSDETRAIISRTPSGIDSKTVVRTPKPVVIKRQDPQAGKIPDTDVRTHQELGLTIEIRQPDANVHGYLEQGYENLMQGRNALAAGFYSQALESEPRNELALFGLATTYQRMHRREEARDLYGRLLAINPTHREALNNFMMLMSDEAPLDALAELEKLETENPDFSPIPAQLGIIHTRLGDYPMAVRKLMRALTLSPDNISYKYNLAIALDKMGRNAEAADLYMELVTEHNNGAHLPGDVVSIRDRAIFLRSKG